MKYLLVIILCIIAFESIGQELLEQKALDYFDLVIKPEFADLQKEEPTFYFSKKPTNKLTKIDFSNPRRPKEQHYRPDLVKLGIGKCDSVSSDNTNAIELNKPDSFQLKEKYKNKTLWVSLWGFGLWRRKDKSEFNVYVDKAIKCGQVHIVNVTIYPTIDSYWYNFNIFFDKEGNVVEWYYVAWIA